LQLVLSGGRQRRRHGPGVVGEDRDAWGALAAEVWELTGARRYAELAELLGDLVPELEAAVRATPGHQLCGLHELMAVAYQACAAALARLGEHDSALIAADRALTAAHRAGDQLAAAACAYLLVCVLVESRRYGQARAIAAAAADALKGPAAGGSVAAICLRGAVTLVNALAAARAGDPAAAGEQLSRARVMAGWLGDDRHGRDAGFGPDHVALYEIAVSIETGAPIRPPGAPAGR
jgi:tetratricopeptide (TPR) repeat protein